MAGNVKQTKNDLLVENSTAYLVAIELEWTGDAVTGSVPTTRLAQSANLGGYLVTNVEIVDGPVAPSSGYSVQLLNPAGIDVLEGAGLNIASSSLSIATTTTVPPLYGALSLVISNQYTPSAKGRVVVYFRRVSLTQLAVQPTGSVSSGGSATMPFIFCENYEFQRRPSTSMSAGVPVTVTLSPMPAGITSGSPNAHNVRIVDPTRGNETVLITARTATTITFTPTLAHPSGGYSITSASGGVQEAIKYAESLPNGNNVWLPAGNTTVYGTIYCAGSPGLAVMGRGLWATNLVVDSSFTSGDIFLISNSTCLVRWQDFLIGGHANHASGAGIHIQNVTAGLTLVQNVTVYDCYSGFWIDNSDYISLRNANFQQVSNQNSAYGIRQTGLCSSNSIVGGYIFSPHPEEATSPAYTWMLDYGLYVEQADGLDVTDLQVRANTGIGIIPQNGQFLGTVKFANCIIDSCRAYAVRVDHSGTPTVFGNVYFSTCHIIRNYPLSVPEGSAVPLVYLGLLGANGAVMFADCVIAGGQTDGVYAVDATNLILEGNTIADNNSGGGTGVGVQIVRGNRVTISGNQIFDQRGGGALQVYGVKLSGVITNYVMTGNEFDGNTSDSVLNNGTLTLSIIKDNVGVDTVNATIASAATITLPAGANRQIIITGTTQIDTINGAIGNGDTAYLYCVGGLQFSAAGNMAKAFLTVGATLCIIQWNTTASKWYLQGT